MPCLLLLLIPCLLLLSSLSVFATPQSVIFFGKLLELVELNPSVNQVFFEMEHFLHAASALHASSVSLGGSKDVLDTATEAVYNDPCLWKLLEYRLSTLVITHWKMKRPDGHFSEDLSECDPENVNYRSYDNHLKDRFGTHQSSDHKSARYADNRPQPSHDDANTVQDQPAFPPNRSRKWLSSRYKTQYAHITGLASWKKDQQGTGFRDYRYNNEEEDAADDAAVAAQPQEDDQQCDVEDEHCNDGDDGSQHKFTPTLDYSMIYNAADDVVLQSLVVRQISHTPRVYVIDNFVTESEIDTLVNVGSDILERTTPGSNSLGNGVRIDTKKDTTGESFEMPIYIHPVTHRISERMAALVKMKNDMGGTLRTRLYQEGESHPPHVDWFSIDLAEGKKSNLIATAMLNLRTTRRGGETEFIDALPSAIKVKPVKGQLVLWWSCTEQGTQEKHSMHQGNAIERGNKFTMTQFFYNDLSSCKVLDEFYEGIPVERENNNR